MDALIKIPVSLEPLPAAGEKPAVCLRERPIIPIAGTI